MRSTTIVASSLAGAAHAAANAGAPANPLTYADCTSTCKPILDVSSQCGFPVPANPAYALNPATWVSNAWTQPSFWANGVTPFAVASSVGWSNANGAGGPGPWGGMGGWGGYGPGGYGSGAGGYGSGAGGYGSGAGGYGSGAGGYGSGSGASGYGSGWGGYGSGWNSANWNLAAWMPTQTNCVCSTKSFSLANVGGDCMTCLSRTNALANPWLNSLATTCNFANGYVNSNGVVVSSPAPAPVAPAAPLPPPPPPPATVPAAPLPPSVGSYPATPKPGTGGPVNVNRRDAHDGDDSEEQTAEVQKKWGSGGGYGSWGPNGGAPPSGSPPAGAPAPVSIVSSPQPQQGGPVFWSGADKTASFKGLGSLALAGAVAMTMLLF